jgi:hypothetical protein
LPPSSVLATDIAEDKLAPLADALLLHRTRNRKFESISRLFRLIKKHQQFRGLRRERKTILSLVLSPNEGIKDPGWQAEVAPGGRGGAGGRDCAGRPEWLLSASNPIKPCTPDMALSGRA